MFGDDITGSAERITAKKYKDYTINIGPQDNLNIYKAVRTLFDIENPNHKPAFTEFRTTAKRDL